MTTSIMTVVPLAVALALLALLALLAAARRARFVLALRRVPGPRALPLLGNALQLTGTQEDFFRLLGRCAAEHGPCFRLWVGTRPFIFLTSAEAVQPILNSSVHIDKSPDYQFVEAWIGSGLVTSTGDKWRRRRKLLTPSFHSRVLDEFLPPLHREARILADKLAAHCGAAAGAPFDSVPYPELAARCGGAAAGAPFDIVPYAKLAALDVICSTALGKHVGAQRNASNAYVVAIDRITSIVQRRFITPWLKPEPLFRLSELSRQQQKCIDVIHGFTGRVFEARKEERQREWGKESGQAKQQAGLGQQDANAPAKPRRRLALLDLLLDLARQGANLTDQDIREEVDTFTFAGHDTTAAALSWSLYELGKHAEVQALIVEEWRAARARSLLGENSSELTVGALSHLEYTERCIKEVLRLYPTVPLLARDIRAPVNILGEAIPAGCTVLVNTFLLHRDERFFPEPTRFDPDRFLPERDAQRHPFAYVPFSAGSRNCIGQRFAMLELKVLLGTILDRFEVYSPDPASSLRLISELVLSNHGGIKICLTPRRHM